MSKPVLLVEDNPDDQLLALYALKKNGLGEEEVAVARGGAEALDYLFGARASRGGDGLPRLVLLDQRLPGVDGPEVLRHLRADDRTASLPVVMLTAGDLSETLDDYGAWTFLRKPLTSKKLAEAAWKLGVRGLLPGEAAPREKQAVISEPARAVSQGDRPLRVLLIEDSEDDAILILRALRRGGHEPVHQRVETRAGMEAALVEEEEWDVLVSDYHLPDFGAMEALEIARKSGLDLPFIVVSGKMGEDVAVEVMRAGAHDYVMKANLDRLGPAAEREVREARERWKRRRAEAALHESEQRFRSLVQNSSDITVVLDARGIILYESSAVERVLGYTPEERVGRNIFDLQRFAKRVSCVRCCIDERVLEGFEDEGAGRGGPGRASGGDRAPVRVSLATIGRYMRRRRETGEVGPRSSPGRTPRLCATVEERRALWTQLEDNPEATLERHRELWKQSHGTRVSVATMSRAIRRLGWTYKKRAWVPPSGINKREVLGTSG